jgi:hypothetical protein
LRIEFPIPGPTWKNNVQAFIDNSMKINPLSQILALAPGGIIGFPEEGNR